MAKLLQKLMLQKIKVTSIQFIEKQKKQVNENNRNPFCVVS